MKHGTGNTETTRAAGLTGERLKSVWNMVFNLSLNFLHNEHDAEDATQEIMLKVHAALPDFRGESSLETWIYRVAFNYLTDAKRSGFGEPISFELFEEDVTRFKPYADELDLSREELRIYVEQIKIGCTRAMLQCLTPVDRFVFILGGMFEFGSDQGAEVCGISETAYRQKLSRSRRKIRNFMSRNCGLVNANAACTCRKRISVALERHRIDPAMLLYRTESKKIKDYVADMNRIDEISGIFRDNPFIDKAALFTDDIRKTVAALAERST